MIKQNITPKQVVKFLNELLKTDRKAITEMFFNYTECNTKLAKHPTVQVRLLDKTYYVRLIGILNGLFGSDKDGWGCICMDVNKNQSKILRFRLITKKDKGGK